jgi:hypothetical protein
MKEYLFTIKASGGLFEYNDTNVEIKAETAEEALALAKKLIKRCHYVVTSIKEIED